MKSLAKNLELKVRIFYVVLCGLILAGCSNANSTSLPASVPNGGDSSLNAPLAMGRPSARESVGSYGYKLLYAFDKSGGDEYPLMPPKIGGEFS